MREWLESLSAGERRAVAGGVAALVLLLMYLTVWQPMERRNAALAKETAQQRADLEWMLEAALDVKALESRARDEPVKDGRTLIARVSSELKADGMSAEQVRPDGENKLRLNLEGVAFSRLLQTLDRLQTRFGVRVREALIEPADTAGLVDCKLLLERGSA